MPVDEGAYLHRAGRVGRMGGVGGTVVSLPIDEEEVESYREIAKSLGIQLEEVYIICVYIRIYIYYIYMHICMHINIYIYIYI